MCTIYLEELMKEMPLVPFIRESDYADRHPWQMPKRRLLDYLLIYVQEGNCLFMVDGIEYRFASGEFCLIQPNSVSSLEGITATRTPFAHMDVFYSSEREQSFTTRAGQLDLSGYGHLMQPRLNDLTGIQVPVRLSIRHPVKFREVLLQMIEAWQNKGAISQLKAQSLATQLLLTILEDHTDPSNKQLSSPQRSLEWMHSYCSYHLSEPIYIEDMARRAHLSPTRFSAVFKAQFGLPPHQYLLNLRVDHAKELLLSTDYPLEEIARYCGFADIHHLSKAFKKKTQKSPQEYRKNKAVEENRQL
jgi:AraC-like DNA-binding protein